MNHDASQSRYLRKKYANQGYDQQEQEQQKQFGQNLQKALETFGKKSKKCDIQSQVQYFGNMIEPFNMREEQDMGDIDQQGYFVFKRKGEYRDAWLDSIEEGNDLMVADKLKKKIKTEGVTFRGLYDEHMAKDKPDDDKINEGDQEEQNDQDGQEQNDNLHALNQNQEQKVSQQSPKELNLQPNQIKQLLCQLLPLNKSANTYVKQLKKNIKNPQSKDLHDKILQLCNMYIQKTNEYDILTSKREQLQEELGEQDQEKSQEIDWDDDGSQQEKGDKLTNKGLNNHNLKPEDKLNLSKQIENRKKYQTTLNMNNQDKEENYSDDDIF